MAQTTQTADDRRYYECRECSHRFTTAEYRAECPECGGRLANLAVPRER